MDKTETLKACPFCGGEADYGKDLDDWFVACQNPISCNALIEGYHTKAEAIAAWNERTPRPDNALADEAVERAAELRDVVMPVIGACLALLSNVQARIDAALKEAK